jgi:microcystin-dependent protein
MTRYAPQWIQAAGYSAAQDRALIGILWPAPASTGCAVTATTAMTLSVAPGQVACPTQNNTGSTLCTSDAAEQVVIAAAPPSGQSRIDLVTCQPRATDIDGGNNNDFIFTTVQGAQTSGTPAVPATPAGAVALAQVAVAGGSVSITQANITDVRPGNIRFGPALPSGVMLDFGGGAAPAGYLLCDGSAVSRTTYANLFAAIGTSWGAGDGSTTFNVPDMRGRVPVAAGAGSGLTARTVAQTGGEENHALSGAEGAAHTHSDPGHGHGDPGHGHTFNDPGHSHGQTYDSGAGTHYTNFAPTNATAVGSSGPNTGISGSGTGASVAGAYSGLQGAYTGLGSSGSGTGHNTMQPFAVVTKIIKT